MSYARIPSPNCSGHSSSLGASHVRGGLISGAFLFSIFFVHREQEGSKR